MTPKHDDDEALVTRGQCAARHGATRWMFYGVFAVLFLIAGSNGWAIYTASDAASKTDTQQQVQSEFKDRVLESLHRIETDLRALRNGGARQ